MRFEVACGHVMVCYSLEPTPQMCPDCADTSRKVFDDMVGFEPDLEDIPSNIDGELDEWLDESGVTVPEIRADIHRYVALIDDVRAGLDHAWAEGRGMLKKYPTAERLVMPAGVQ